jgi:hypothetical protein
MKRKALLIRVLAITALFGMSVMKPVTVAAREIPPAELRDFQAFLNAHPEVREDLSKNPNLVKDTKYLQAHSGLNQFLQSHPRIRQEADANPSGFVRTAVLYGPENQPDMTAALQHLRQAQEVLEKALGDKGGHRVKAIELIKQAENEVQAGINYANTH